MRLNYLEISGFKSFPERAELAFDDGVTAIVGPNGCGKSNVIDAITWVLGEQSARSLRGERMEDVIFSGSAARRPTAAAEVRLQLSEVTAALVTLGGRGHGNGHEGGNGRARAAGGNGNGYGNRGTGPVVAAATVTIPDVGDDDAEFGPPLITRDVEVGRRLYRSGESEYLIDGQVCRLRDIQDLLMDSGIGLKAYAVIEQGKIGQILSARPAERRQLLEEAAGVTKYKTRRRAAELKLEAAEQNLTRVDDIVFEVEKQRSALKRQAAKARRYRRLREELRRWEKVGFARKSQALARAIEAADRRLAEVRVRERGAAARLAGFEGEMERLRIELAETEQKATATRDAAHQRELDLGRRQQHIDFDKRQATTLAAALATGETELRVLEQRSDPIRDELAGQQQARTRHDAEREAAFRGLDAEERAFAAAQRAIEGFEGDVEAARSEVFAVINAATALQNVVDNAAVSRGRIAEELAKLEAEATDVATKAARNGIERERVDHVTRRTCEALETARVGRADRDAELASVRIEREWRARDVRTHEHEIAAMRARLASLEELEAARAGYGDAARVVLASDGQVRHHGSVADHLEVEHSHERAVESCLGDLLQYVVVRSREDAFAGMALARAKNAGRCGFLIAEGHQPPPSPTPPHARLRPLWDVVRTSGPGEQVVRSLLAGRWLAASLEDAAAAAEVTNDPIATSDGVVFRGPSIVSGGGKPETRGILAAKREIKELGGRIASTEADVQRLNEEIASFAAVAARAEAALTALQAEEHKHEKALVGLEMQIRSLDDERARLTEKQDVIDRERRKAVAEREGLDAKQAEARESITRLEAEQTSADERFMGAQRRLLEARESVDALSERVTDAKARHAALAERSAALAADVRRLEDQTSDLRQRISAREAENRRVVSDREGLLISIATSERQRDEDVTAFESLRAEIRSVDEETDELRQRIADQDATVRAARRALDQARADVGRLEVERATADSDLLHLSTSCVETLQLSLEAVRAEVERLELEGAIRPDPSLIGPASREAEDADADSDAAGPETASAATADDDEPVPVGDSAGTLDVDDIMSVLRAKIDRLGPVNMMAIDQFDELEERHEFLTTQRQDLLESIAATGEAIKRIDVTTRERFREAFTAVNEYFQHTFQTLFGGGRAGLVLLDETDMLESGIDIIAQPPGKRLQSIQLLSGGEKALTAMALMFAIFRYKPSPFCLLDEIDAPLDDANIGRFVDMLRGLQDHTQFVLVTHNRKTMEIADRLYGVTMEEPGVSKLISVKLD